MDLDAGLAAETAAGLGGNARAVGGDVSRRADVARAVSACAGHATIVLDGGQTLGIPLEGVVN